LYFPEKVINNTVFFRAKFGYVRFQEVSARKLYTAQARRQDIAPGGAKNQKGRPHFKNTVLDVGSNQGAKREWGGTDFKWGAEHHWPPAGDIPDTAWLF